MEVTGQIYITAISQCTGNLIWVHHLKEHEFHLDEEAN